MSFSGAAAGNWFARQGRDVYKRRGRETPMTQGPDNSAKMGTDSGAAQPRRCLSPIFADFQGNFDNVARALGLSAAAAEGFAAGWQASRESFPPDGPEFLRRVFVVDTCATLGLSDEIAAAIAASLAMFDGSEPLQRLAWHCSQSLRADGHVEFRPAAMPWTTLLDDLPAWGEMFFPAVLLSAGSRMIDLHRGRGIPAEITRATAGDVELWMRHYRARHGRWGLAHAKWLANHFLGRIYRLGRLQFRFERFEWAFRALRRRGGGRVVVVAEDGMGADGEAIRAKPVSPAGQVLPQRVELPSDEWQTVLKRGDAVLGVHIPEGGPMDFDACGRSFRRAMEFFARHFPEFGFRAFQCESWLLDDQLGQLLPPESNIRRFQEEMYLLPLAGADDSQMFDRVFGLRYDDIRQAPQDTLLRRTIANHILAGGQFRTAACILLPEDLDWGAKVYRN